MTTRQFTFPAAGLGLGPGRKHFSIQTHNKLIYNTPGATGVKNGYTIAARGSFVGSATRNGHAYIAVIMRAEGSTWHTTSDLLEWAFAHGAAAKPVGTLITPTDAQALLAQPEVDAARGGDVAAASADLRAATQSRAGPRLSDQARIVLVAVLAIGLLLAVIAGGLMLRTPGLRTTGPDPVARRRQRRRAAHQRTRSAVGG